MSDVSTLPDARARALRLLAGVAVLVAAAGGTGLAVGRAIWADRPTGDVDGWSDLGFGIAALVIGLIVCGLVYLAGLVLAVRWAMPRGRRLVAAFTVLAATLALVVVGGLVTSRAAQGGMPAAGAVTAVIVAGALAAGVGVVVDAVRPRTAGWLGGAAAACVVVVVAVGGLRADRIDEHERADRYAATGAPLALVDGRGFTPPVDGWDLAYIDPGWSSHQVSVTFDVPSRAGDRPEQVWLVMDRDPNPRPCEDASASEACVVVDRVPPGESVVAGSEIVADPIAASGATGSRSYWVEFAGGRWTIRGTDLAEADAAAVLTALVPVDADTFAAAT